MKTSRMSPPVALVKDKYIIAAGGQITVQNKGNYYTNTSEVYDIASNTWTNTGNLRMARGNTSITSIGSLVFIFHGLLPQIQASQSTCVEYINLGPCTPQSFRAAQWDAVNVQNPDFISNEPKASHFLGPNELIVFGGNGCFTYQVDITNVL